MRKYILQPISKYIWPQNVRGLDEWNMFKDCQNNDIDQLRLPCDSHLTTISPPTIKRRRSSQREVQTGNLGGSIPLLENAFSPLPIGEIFEDQIRSEIEVRDHCTTRAQQESNCKIVVQLKTGCSIFSLKEEIINETNRINSACMQRICWRSPQGLANLLLQILQLTANLSKPANCQ